MASVVPRKNRNGTTTFQVKTRHAGRQVSESFTSVVIARQFAALVEKHGWEAATAIRDDRTNSPRNRAPITLNEWFAQWIEYLPGVTGGTAIDYKRMANRTWLVDLGDYPVDSIKRDHVLKWLATYRTTPTAKTGRPPAANTIANAHALLFTVMASAVEANHAPTNPCRGIRLPKSEHVESTFLTQGEFAQLLAHIDVHYQPLVAYLAGTGCRWGEATALQWRDVDLEARPPSVRISRSWKRAATGQRELGAPKTERSRRTISLPESIADQLRDRGIGTGELLVFTTEKGLVVDDRRFRPNVWLPAIVASGIGKKPRIHDLRHTHASWLIQANVPLPVIQRRLGHTSITTTVDTYGHLADGAAELAARVTDLALTQALPAIEG